MPHLPTPKDCCGCGACVDACPKEAIRLLEDKNCYYNIQIDVSKCVECKLCEKQCHILHPEKLVRSNPQQVKPVAAWSLDDELVKHSATGGIFAQVASNMLAEDHTYVYGASLQDDNSVKHIEISDVADLKKLQNSKYQQSYSVGIYAQVRKRLKEGARVLFSGTPCQIAALYSFLSYRPAFIENLYTIEVLCHGVPSNDIHRVALKSHGAKKIIAYRNKVGRGWCNKNGNNNRLTYLNKKGEQFIVPTYLKDVLFRSYLTFNFTRQNCFHCPYADIHRVADLTIGDFWGWEKTPNPEKYENYWGTSVVLPNTPKGKEMMQGKLLHTVSTTWEEFMPINQNLYMPTNIYDYKGYKYMAFLKHLPVCIRRVIYQGGFSNSFLNKFYVKAMIILFTRKRAQALLEKDRQSKNTLKYLHRL